MVGVGSLRPECRLPDGGVTPAEAQRRAATIGRRIGIWPCAGLEQERCGCGGWAHEVLTEVMLQRHEKRGERVLPCSIHPIRITREAAVWIKLGPEPRVAARLKLRRKPARLRNDEGGALAGDVLELADEIAAALELPPQIPVDGWVDHPAGAVLPDQERECLGELPPLRLIPLRGLEDGLDAREARLPFFENAPQLGPGSHVALGSGALLAQAAAQVGDFSRAGAVGGIQTRELLLLAREGGLLLDDRALGGGELFLRALEKGFDLSVLALHAGLELRDGGALILQLAVEDVTAVACQRRQQNDRRQERVAEDGQHARDGGLFARLTLGVATQVGHAGVRGGGRGRGGDHRGGWSGAGGGSRRRRESGGRRLRARRSGLHRRNRRWLDDDSSKRRGG